MGQLEYWNGSTWVPAVVGAQGYQGNQGVQGSQGSQGYQGYQGYQGSQGYQGNQGTQGTQGASFPVTSTTSLTIGTGSKTLTTSTGLAYTVGQVVSIYNTANPANYMLGNITTYSPSSSSMTVNVTSTGGSGTYAAWTVNVSGIVGPQGLQGYQGTAGPSGSQGSQGAQGPQGNQGTSGVATANATTTSLGLIQLAGDLAGTATSPTVTSVTHVSTGTLPVANGGTGVTTSTGSGSNVLSNTPVITTPVIVGAYEAGTVSSTVLSGSTSASLAASSGMLYLYTANPTASYTIALTGCPTVTGQAATFALGVNNGSTAYLPLNITINGTQSGASSSALPAQGATNNGIQTWYQGGTAWSSADASTYDFYTITVICTGSSTWVMLLGLTKF